MKRKIAAFLLAICLAGSLAACGKGPAKAEPDENGNYVVNGGFEAADFTGWTVTNIDDVTEELDVYTQLLCHVVNVGHCTPAKRTAWKACSPCISTPGPTR